MTKAIVRTWASEAREFNGADTRPGGQTGWVTPFRLSCLRLNYDERTGALLAARVLAVKHQPLPWIRLRATPPSSSSVAPSLEPPEPLPVPFHQNLDYRPHTHHVIILDHRVLYLKWIATTKLHQPAYQLLSISEHCTASSQLTLSNITMEPWACQVTKLGPFRE